MVLGSETRTIARTDADDLVSNPCREVGEVITA
jgi:hypothetical protein